MTTQFTITTKKEVEIQHKINLPYYCKSSTDTFYKVTGIGRWDVIKICKIHQFEEITKAPVDLALRDTEPCTESEFLEAYNETLEILNNLKNK
jgi:hypothetical protein